MVENEGYIKFAAHWKNKTFPCPPHVLDEINTVRSKLINKGWLGVLPNGIGFGNISVRVSDSESFIITGSATGGIKRLNAEHFALVERFSIAENQLWCSGLTIASSESLTHAALYQSSENIKTVLHIHSEALWKKHYDRIATSDQNAPYGTPAMAFSIATLCTKIQANSGIIIMGGHQDGLIAFGQNTEQVYNLLIQL